jgi:hypothetical protein
MSIGESPTKGSDKYAKVILSTDTKPVGAFLGQLIIESDTGLVYEWTGSGWDPRLGGVQIDPLVNSIPTTSTFHHLGHEGKVFIYSARTAAIASEANHYILIRLPADAATRQMHMRYAFSALANTGTLDVDVSLYKEPTVTAPGDATVIANTNDFFGLSTGITIFDNSTISVDGTFKVITSMTGTNKSTSSRDTSVPEWILTPDGASARDYIFKITNNGAGTADVTTAIFFYDTEAA